jgi:hypothetical protein
MSSPNDESREARDRRRRRRLVTAIERPELAAATSTSASVAKLGTLRGRTAGPADPIGAATAALLREGRRRLAVVDDSGRLLGLLCLKKDGTGDCSDEGIRERAQRAIQPRHQRSPAGFPEAAGNGSKPVREVRAVTGLSAALA